MNLLLWGLVFLLVSCLFGLLVGRGIRIADEREAERRAAMSRHPSSPR